MNWFVKMSKKRQDKMLFHNDWLSLKEKDGKYVYSHEERCNGHMVAVLGWRSKEQSLEILGRYEVCPAHDDGLKLCSLTGGIDKNNGDWEKLALEFAEKELKEESGITIPKKKFKSLGIVRPTKSTDTYVHLFSVELMNEEPLSEPEGDGSEGEKGSYCKWVSYDEAVNCKDPLLHSMMLRLKKEEK